MIREANPDDANAAAFLIVQAMGELANKFSNTTDVPETYSLFEYFFKQKNNQYSYEHTLVYKNNGLVLGVANCVQWRQADGTWKKLFRSSCNP